jgi:hypothetical protein
MEDGKWYTITELKTNRLVMANMIKARLVTKRMVKGVPQGLTQLGSHAAVEFSRV